MTRARPVAPDDRHRRDGRAVALGAAHVDEWMARWTGKPPKAPLAGVRMAAYKMWFNPAKAIQELGLPQTPPEQALADAVEWFRAQGHAP